MSQMNLSYLIEEINRERVIPVIGSELCMVSSGKPTYLYDFLAKELAEKHGIEYQNEPLHKVAANKGFEGIDIYTKIKDIYVDIEKEEKYPEKFCFSSFDKLAKIPQFKIFLSITFTDLLQQRLSAIRGKENVQVIDFSLTRVQIGDVQPGKTLIINLLGSIKSTCKEFAVTEEEYLEYFFHIITESDGLLALKESLLNKIKESSFLYLGCSFPSWYARYIVRGLTQTRYKHHKLSGNIFIDESTSAADDNKTFFTNFRSHVLDDADSIFANYNAAILSRGNNRADTFVSTLANILQSKITLAGKKIEGKVFISYYSKDKETAEGLYLKLRAHGIDPWFDAVDLPGGAHKPEIKNKLATCNIFLPLISSTLLEDVVKAREKQSTVKDSLRIQETESEIPYCVREEWESIHERFEKDEYYTRSKLSDKIMPFVISSCLVGNLDKMHPEIPAKFREQHIYSYPNEEKKLIQDIIDYLTTSRHEKAN